MGFEYSWCECSYSNMRERPTYQRFSESDTFRFHPHSYGMHLKSEGLSHGLRKCPPDTFLPCLRQGRPFESLSRIKKSECPQGHSDFLAMVCNIDTMHPAIAKGCKFETGKLSFLNCPFLKKWKQYRRY